MESSSATTHVMTLPVVPLRDLVIFPHMMAPFIVGRESSVRAVKLALSTPDKRLFLVVQRDLNTNNPQRTDLREMGVVALVVQNLKIPNGNIKVMVEGEQRAKLKEFSEQNGATFAEIEMVATNCPVDEELKAYMSKVLSKFEQYAKISHHLAFEGLMPTLKLDDPGRFADLLAAHLMVSTAEKQSLLRTVSPSERLQLLGDMLDVEIEKFNLDKRINVQVKKQMERAQKVYYLQEKVKAISEELARGDWTGEAKDKEKEYLEAKIEAIKEELEREDGRGGGDQDPEQVSEGVFEISDAERRINKQVKKQMERAQKEYYLKEKMRAIREEMGLGEELADEGKESADEDAPSILRSIEFPPEYHEAGVSILSYFATVLRQKYAGMEASVTITQEGNRVAMAIETPEGEREKIERTLTDYGMVVQGHMAVEQLLHEPVHILELRSELRRMHARLEDKRELIAYQQATIEGLNAHLNRALQPAAPVSITFHSSPSASATVQQLCDLKGHLPAIQAHFQEAAKALPTEQGQKLLEAGAELAQLDGGADEGSARAALSKASHVFQDLGDEKSKLSKALKGAGKALQATQAAGRHYNSIAQWCGLPVLPDVMLGSKGK